ncbi:MAG: PadR family transcriptional regulator [Chloroflexi bacterium]|nr:PadR family transcriptional regulator [Chloroflexota bacterium]
MTDTKQLLPLTPAVFHILLALAKGEKHGYEIMKAVRQDSNDKVKMGNGTLYGSLKRMLSDELIEDAGDRAEGDDTRRKYYKLTSLGRRALNAEIQRYIDTTEVIKQYKLVPHCLATDSTL